MRLRTTLFAALLIGGAGFTAPRLASAEEDWAARQQREQQAQAAFEQERAAITPLLEKLKSTPREQWQPSDIDAYFCQQLRTFNACLATRMVGYQDAPWSLLEVLLKHDKPWEFAYNPLTVDAEGNWLPTQELTPGDPFSPGGLVYQFCPPERYSLSDGWPRPSSYELSIYGREQQAPGIAGALPAVTPGNEAWARVLPGTLAQAGHYAEPMPAGAMLPDGVTTAASLAQKSNAQREAGIRFFNEKLRDLPHGSNWRPYWAIHDIGSVVVESDRLRELEAALRAKPREQWSNEEIGDYLQTAAWQVYGPLQAASQLDLLNADSVDDLIALKVLPQIPPNPLNDWQPMRILRAEDGYSAGDLCLQTAPPAQQHDVNAPFWDNSFVVSIYGPDAGTTSMDPGAIFEIDRDWAQVLPGSAYGMSKYTEMRAYSEFERVVAWDGVSEQRMLREDGSRRRIPQSIGSMVVTKAPEALRAAPAESFSTERDIYLRKMAVAVYGALELYKYEHGSLPADPRELVGDYLDNWPGNPLAAAADGSWAPIEVVSREEQAAPGALLWQPGYVSPERYVQKSLSANGGLGDPALAYRLCIYGEAGADGKPQPLLVIDATAENPLELYSRTRGKSTEDIEAVFSKRAPNRTVWPAKK